MSCTHHFASDLSMEVIMHLFKKPVKIQHGVGPRICGGGCGVLIIRIISCDNVKKCIPRCSRESLRDAVGRLL